MVIVVVVVVVVVVVTVRSIHGVSLLWRYIALKAVCLAGLIKVVASELIELVLNNESIAMTLYRVCEASMDVSSV